MNSEYPSDLTDHEFVDRLLSSDRISRFNNKSMNTYRLGDVIHGSYFPNTPIASSHKYESIEKQYNATDENEWAEFVADVHSITLACQYSEMLEVRKVEHTIAQLAKEFKEKIMGFNNLWPEGTHLKIFSGDVRLYYFQSYHMLYKLLLDAAIMVRYTEEHTHPDIFIDSMAVPESMFHDLLAILKPKTLGLEYTRHKTILPLSQWVDENLESMIKLSPDIVYQDYIQLDVSPERTNVQFTRPDRVFLTVDIDLIDGQPVVKEYRIHNTRQILAIGEKHA